MGKIFPNLRTDAIDPNIGAHFERDLDDLREQVLEHKIPPQNAMTLIPQEGNVGTYAKTYTHRMAELVGVAQMIADYADDLPIVDAVGEEDTYNVKMFGCAYQFSRKEMLATDHGIDLDTMRPRSARVAIEQKFNRLQWYGDPTAGIFGFLNFPFIPRHLASIPFDSTQDPQDILAEMNTIANRPSIDTDTVAEPDTMLMAPAQYNYVATTPLAEGSDTTILQHFLGNNPYINSVENVQELRDAGPDGEDLVIVYRRSSEIVQHKLVEPFTQLEPQQRNLAVVTNCVAQTGGVVSDYPAEMLIAELPE